MGAKDRDHVAIVIKRIDVAKDAVLGGQGDVAVARLGHQALAPRVLQRAAPDGVDVGQSAPHEGSVQSGFRLSWTSKARHDGLAVEHERR